MEGKEKKPLYEWKSENVTLIFRMNMNENYSSKAKRVIKQIEELLLLLLLLFIDIRYNINSESNRIESIELYLNYINNLWWGESEK